MLTCSSLSLQLKEVENLRSVNAELAEFRHKYDDQQMMLQQAQAYRAQIDQNVSLYQAESAELRYIFRQAPVAVFILREKQTSFPP